MPTPIAFQSRPADSDAAAFLSTALLLNSLPLADVLTQCSPSRVPQTARLP